MIHYSMSREVSERHKQQSFVAKLTTMPALIGARKYSVKMVCAPTV
jgi:hypothetical protein